ncbi:MAG: T9SS type A sorting domain-containing protein [Saprospiraceae bacterium]
MKQLYFLISIASLCTATLSAQQTQSTFVNENNRWHEAFCGVDFNNGNIDCTLIRFLFRDTVHQDGNIYYKLYEANEFNYDSLKFTGNLYREDTAGNVFMKELLGNGYSDEFLMYKFQANIGETIQLGDSFNDLPVKVTAIDSVTLLSGAKRKRLTLESDFIQEKRYWIEGIGADYGTLDTRYMYAFDAWRELACYQYNGEIEYETEACNLRTGTREPQLLHFVTVFPNPFTHSLTIRTDQPGFYNVQLFDAIGRLLWQQQLMNNDLNMSLLPAGAYYLRIQDEKGNFQIEKVIKTK